MRTDKNSYASAGVDIDSADRAKSLIARIVRKTFTEGVVGDFGGFGSLFSAHGFSAKNDLLVSSTDSVGTKLKVAFMAGRHNTIGQDLVNHLVNDILCMGARPLFFLDYIGMGKLDEKTVCSIVEGIAEGCRQNGCALVGGETAELPGLYKENEYDLVGFIVGVVKKSSLPDRNSIKPGDVLVGFSSSGLHTNGYSLARKAFFDIGGLSVDDVIPETGTKVGDELLNVHRSYFKSLYPYMKKRTLKALAHITGGGFTGNISRILPSNVDAVVETSYWKPPGIFKAIQRLAKVETEQMYRVFNMGIGMVGAVAEKDIPYLRKTMKLPDCEAVPVGMLVEGSGKVIVKL